MTLNALKVTTDGRNMFMHRRMAIKEKRRYRKEKRSNKANDKESWVSVSTLSKLIAEIF